MFMFALLSTFFLVVLRTRAVDDGSDRDSPETSTLIAISKNIHANPYLKFAPYGDVTQAPRRRLLEHPYWIKQAYRSNDYDVIRRHEPRNKLDVGGSYRSSVKDVGDEDGKEEEEEEEEQEQEQEEENENNEGDRTNDEAVDEETDQDEDENEETVGDVVRNRLARSGYVPFEGEADERDKQEMVKIGASEECDYESTEAPQYYEYETEVKNVASQDGKLGGIAVANILGMNLLILLLI